MTGNQIIEIIRTEIEDFLREQHQYHEVKDVSATVIPLWEDNVEASSIEIQLNGTPVNTNWYYNAQLNSIILDSGFQRTEGDIVYIHYYFYGNYSNSIIKKYIEAGLNRINAIYPKDLRIEDTETGDFIIKDYSLSGNPEIDNKFYSLVALVSAILIKPDYTQYRALDVSFSFRRDMDKDMKIEYVINKFKMDKIGNIEILYDPDSETE